MSACNWSTIEAKARGYTDPNGLCQGMGGKDEEAACKKAAQFGAGVLGYTGCKGEPLDYAAVCWNYNKGWVGERQQQRGYDVCNQVVRSQFEGH